MLFCPVAPGAPGCPLPGSGALALSLCSRPWEGSGSCCRKFSQPQQPDRSPDPTWLTTVAGAAWASSLLSCSVVGSGTWPTRALTYRPGAHHSQQSRRPSSPAWGSLSSAMWWLWLVVPTVLLSQAHLASSRVGAVSAVLPAVPVEFVCWSTAPSTRQCVCQAVNTGVTPLSSWCGVALSFPGV